MTDLPDEHYSPLDFSQRKQGDIYSSTKFEPQYLPPVDIPHWMLLNRSCQLLSTESRKCKLPSLNYSAVYKLTINTRQSI